MSMQDPDGFNALDYYRETRRRNKRAVLVLVALIAVWALVGLWVAV